MRSRDAAIGARGKKKLDYFTRNIKTKIMRGYNLMTIVSYAINELYEITKNSLTAEHEARRISQHQKWRRFDGEG